MLLSISHWQRVGIKTIALSLPLSLSLFGDLVKAAGAPVEQVAASILREIAAPPVICPHTTLPTELRSRISFFSLKSFLEFLVNPVMRIRIHLDAWFQIQRLKMKGKAEFNQQTFGVFFHIKFYFSSLKLKK